MLLPNLPSTSGFSAQRPRIDDTLDRMLEENLREPALSRIRCKIADSQRALMKRIDELTMERDSVHIQKLVLQQNYNLLSSYFQLTALTQQSQQPINSDKLLMNQLMMNAAATSGNLGPAPPVTSNFGAPAALATADPSTTAFNNLIAQLLNSPSASLNGGLGSMAPPMTQQNLSFEKAKLFLPNGTIDPSVLLGSINGSA